MCKEQSHQATVDSVSSARLGLGYELEQLIQSICKTFSNLFKRSALITIGSVTHNRLLMSTNAEFSLHYSNDLQLDSKPFPAADQSPIDRMDKAISRRR